MARRKGRLTNDSFAIAPVNFPTGCVLDFAGDTAPNGWLLCYGQAVSRTEYAGLFATLGETYGSGDGSTTFNLPDYRGRVLVGKDNMGGSAAGRMTSLALSVGDGNTLGSNGGAQTHTLSEAQMPQHTHIQNSHNHAQQQHRHAISSRENGATSDTTRILGENTGGAIKSTNSDFVTAVNIAETATNQQTGSSSAHQNTQPSIIANKIIKV